MMDASSTVRIVAAVCVCTASVSCGCSTSATTEFRLNTEGRDVAEIRTAQRQAIRTVLERLFGTPDAPRLPADVPLRLPLLQTAAASVRSDAEGNQFGLYRQHCASCHAISGDGAGPTALVQNPYPRDFRNGWFKYTSTAGGAKPVREDIERLVSRGIPGTAMPAFKNLPDVEIDSLVEYMQYLSVRGETELYVLQLVIDEDEYLPLDVRLVIDEGVLPAVGSWSAARSMQVAPPPRPAQTANVVVRGANNDYAPAKQLAASIARGGELFLSKDAQCSQCHGPLGNGRGEQSELYDDWNEPKKGITPKQTKELGRLYRLPLRRVRPRDLTEGIFRGGSDPEDLYLRIHVGIKGTPMPAGGPAPGSSGVLTPEQIWNVVDFVRSLSR